MSESSEWKFLTAIGIVLLLLSLVLFTNGYFCTFNRASCGMVEPLIGIPVCALGLGLVVCGMVINRRRRR